MTVKPPFVVNWSLPTYYALELGPKSHMAGRVTAALWIDPALADDIWVGTEESGIWRVNAGVPTVLGSYDWTAPLVRSLVLGPRSKGHIYCGTNAGIMEADGGAPGGSFTFQRVNGIPGGGIGALLVLAPFLVARSIKWWRSAATTCWLPLPTPVCGGLPFPRLWASATAGAPIRCEPGQFHVGVCARFSRVDRCLPCGCLRSEQRNSARDLDAEWIELGRNDTRRGRSTCRWAPADRRRQHGERQVGLGVPPIGRGSTWSSQTDATPRRGWPCCAPIKAVRAGSSRTTIPVSTSSSRPTAMRYMGIQADRNLVVAVHPKIADTVLIAGQRTGPLGSVDGGANWDANRWRSFYEDDPWPFHPDALCLEFSPYDPSGNTLVAGSDGGVFVSRDLGTTWDSSGNERFPTLMFDQRWQSTSPALSASSQYHGLLVGGLQDNGSVYLPADNQPWHSIIGGDGFRALFVSPDVVFMGSNDKVGLKWARWTGAAFTDAVQLAPPGYPDAGKFTPFLSRVEYPSYRDPAGNALMVAVAGDELSNDVFGLFDRGPATDPPQNRFYWKSLATLPTYATALDSLDGKRVLVGSADTTMSVVYAASGAVIPQSLPAGLASEKVRWMRWATAGTAFCLVDNTLLRTTNLATWTTVAGPKAPPDIEVIEVDRAWDPVGLFVGGSDGVWLSRDLGATWRETTGLPLRPHVNHMEVVEWPPNDRVIHAGTWNWSAWRASLT